MALVKAEFPEKLQCLFTPNRYKVLYGGRGGSKSWGVARALLIQGAAKPLRILCGREIQKSISDSVHKLLSDQITELGINSFYTIQNNLIKGRNGTEFTFHGLKHNIHNLKSVEGTDIVWIEEAQTVSKSSWDTLIPTIRKEGSEIWITFNPELDDDETYKRFVLSPPTGAIVQKVNWSDNPWFPAVLMAEKDTLRERDMDSYLTVWEGNCRVTLDGAIYANELRLATEEGRICRVPYDASKPVHTFFDLGWADNTSIWFAQAIGFEFRIIDFMEDSKKPITHYMAELQKKGYVYGNHWLPHDAQSHQLGTGKSIESIMKEAGFNTQIVGRSSIAEGINASRVIFNRCYFDAEKCSSGINQLRRYRYDVNPDTGQYSKQPLHDNASHAADAFRYMAVAIESEDRGSKRSEEIDFDYAGSTGWMS